ncbi:MAG: glutamine amidotransferase [Deltaproteobacteria bacterium]|nr:glutamine amidotransferase [Deltaproteobacteria bacterium]
MSGGTRDRGEPGRPASDRPLLILECGGVAFARAGLVQGFGAMFLEAGRLAPGEAVVVNAVEGPPAPRPEDFSGIIVTGSLGMANDLPPWTQRAMGWLGAAALRGLPILGVCYGHHLMAMIFGGQVGFHPGGLELGCHQIVLAPGAGGHPLLKDLPARFPARLAHSQTVLRPPARARILASSRHDAHQILDYGPGLLSCQFHPEFSALVMDAFIAELSGHRAPPGRPAGLCLGREPMGTNHAQSLLRNFIQRCR